MSATVESHSALARKIIEDAMTQPAVYADMARRENAAWSKELRSREAAEALTHDQKAAAELRLNRDQISLPAWARANNRRFMRGLSIGCGEGRAERRLIQQRVCAAFEGIDIATGALAEARAEAAANRLDITYREADINFVDLPSQRYDLIIAQTSLHHVLRLEPVADQIARALAPGGIVWIHDYVGESQFQYSDARLEVVNRIIGSLPERYRFDRVHHRQLGLVARRKPGTLISPFESIRSEEIPEIFASRFATLERRETMTLLHLVAPVGTRASYTADDASRTLFEVIHQMDRALAVTGALAPVTGQYILTTR
jgi:SAM-dependent methyltransferase